MSADLRCGRWQDVLADVECDAVITDPPYSKRTHEGQEAGADGAERLDVEYDHWTADHVHEFVRSWSPRTRGWMANMTSHDLIPHWEAAYAEAGRYFFAPVPLVCTNPQPRMVGDGPTSGCVYLMVARPKRRDFVYIGEGEGTRWGSLPGHYRYTRPPGQGGGGRGKPLLLLEAIVRDYTEPGDLVVDPCFGWGSTFQATRVLGRRGVGAEVDREAFAEAQRRLGRPVNGDLFAGGRAA